MSANNLLRQKLGKTLINGQQALATRAAPSHGAVVNYTQQRKDRRKLIRFC